MSWAVGHEYPTTQNYCHCFNVGPGRRNSYRPEPVQHLALENHVPLSHKLTLERWSADTDIHVHREMSGYGSGGRIHETEAADF